MVIKPEEVKKKAEEIEKSVVKHRARTLEEVLNRDLAGSVEIRLSRTYNQYAPISSSDPMYHQIMDTIIEDCRKAGWEAEYTEEKRDNGYTVTVKTRVTLKIGKNAKAKSDCLILSASTVEARLVALEEAQASKHEKDIDQQLIHECREKAVWYCIEGMEDRVREMLEQRYADAGWKVALKQRWDQTKDWKRVQNNYIVFERQE